MTCKKASALGFMLANELYINNVDYEQYRKYALAQRKKLLPGIFELDLVEALEFYDREKKITPKTIDEYTDDIPVTATKCIQYLENWKATNQGAIIASQKPLSKDDDDILKLAGEESLKAIEKKLSDVLGFKIKDLPEVIKKDGTKASKYLLATLLYKDISYIHYNTYMYDCWMDEDYKTIKSFSFEPNKTANQIMEIIDEKSLQSSFIEIAECLSELKKYSKKFKVLRAISLYANEETMKKIIQIGDEYLIDEHYLYDCWCYSSAKAAILYADKKKFMKQYAELRGYDEDKFREKYLFDCGLDENGCVEFDLGETVVKAHLENDYKFALSDNTGNKLKSFPRTSSDDKKYKIAKEKYDEIKTTIESIRKNLKKKRMEDYLNGNTMNAQDWSNAYMGEYLHKLFASTIVWSQDKKTFTVNGNLLICADGSQYTLELNKKVSVAHVMEMKQTEIEKWREYFLKNCISQPFEQVWELPIDFNSVNPDRYEGIILKEKILMGKSAHGIIYHKPQYWAGEGPKVDFLNKSLCMPELMDCEKENHICFGKIELLNKDRIANHVIYLLDKWTVFGRIAKNDISVMEHMDKYNLAQIMEFIDVAAKNNAKDLNAALLEYKNRKYPEYDAFDYFTIEEI